MILHIFLKDGVNNEEDTGGELVEPVGEGDAEPLDKEASWGIGVVNAG